MPRPKILFLMSDEHRPDVAGFAGNSVVRTPVLDELARTGVVFDNAYTPSPICIPARQCIMAGQLPRTCGCEWYGQDLPPFSMTLPRQLSRYGYESVCSGKMHHMGPDQMQGWTSRLGADCNVALPARGVVEPADVTTETGIGKWSDAKEIKRAGIGRGANTTDVDRYALDGALLWTRTKLVDPYYDRGLARDQPVLLKLSFTRPHYPYFTTEDKFAYYLNRVEPFFDEQVFDHPFLNTHRVEIGKDVTEREVRRATAAYYGMVEEIDDDFGTLMRELEHAGEDLDDWWILYTSDHGEMLGEHGIWEKQKFFEASARVPLIVRPPKGQREAWGCHGRRVRENVNLCDLFATLCDAADVPLPGDAETLHGRGLDSRSLLPLMRGDTSAWHDRYRDETVSQFGGTNLMIKRGTLKYQRYDGEACAAQPEVLFDLDVDPGESRNLLGEARYAEAVTTFRERAAALGFGPDADGAYRNADY